MIDLIKDDEILNEWAARYRMIGAPADLQEAIKLADTSDRLHGRSR